MPEPSQALAPRRPPRRLLIGLAVAALLAGCALSSPDAPACSGPRRPANPRGSILTPGTAGPEALDLAPALAPNGGCGGGRP